MHACTLSISRTDVEKDIFDWSVTCKLYLFLDSFVHFRDLVVPPPLLTFGFSARTMESLRKWKAPSMGCLKRSPGCTRRQDCPWQQQPCCKVSVSGTLYSDDSLGKANTDCMSHSTLHCEVGFCVHPHPQLVRLYLVGRGTHHRLMALSSSSAFPPCHASAAWHL